MSIFFTNLIFALAFSSSSSSTAHQSPSPTIHCNIVLKNWCIANSPSKISMVDLAYRRLWLVTSPIGMQYGPLIISTDKTCSKIRELNVVFVDQSKRKVAKNGEIYVATFNLDKDKCSLKFAWPAGAANSYSYQEFMAFRVFVGKQGSNDYTPLFKFYDRTRCHGVFIKRGTKCE